MKLLKLFTKRIYDQKRRFMILTLDDHEARVADVFLMLSETQKHNEEQDGARVELAVSVDDIAHWAGMPPDKSRAVINHFVSQRRLEVLPDRIVIKNINDFARFVQSKRRATDE
jgi:hypothetical protein